jgi:hypothetical protein
MAQESGARIHRIPAGRKWMDDQQLQEKFRKNAFPMLSPEKIEQALKTIFSLEELDDVSRLMGLFQVAPTES